MMAEQQNLGKEFQKEIDRVEDYKFEPIKGYPMLNWKGKRPFESTQFYPAQLKETHGEEVDSWYNRIYWGDNLQVMSHLVKEFRGKVQLIYIDPPFDSKADYKKKIQLRGKAVTNDQNAFEEKQYTDIWSNDEYLQFIYERLVILRELLSDTGGIYIHLDSKRSHYIKIILDEIFGQENYKFELIWKRQQAHSDSKMYANLHDSILFYSKTSEMSFNTQYIAYTDKHIKENYRYSDEKGQFALGQLKAPGDRGPKYSWNGIVRHWRYTEDNMQKLHNENHLYYSSSGVPWKKLYLLEMPGVVVGSIWNDISPIHAQDSTERLDYPTQKPEALLERIINASSKPNDIVFDCFMGSGTTQAVAMKLGRRFIGADINLGAVQTTTKRLISLAKELKETDSNLTFNFEEGNSKLNKFYTGFQVHNVNHYDFFRNELEAKDLLIKALEIQPVVNNSLYDGEKDGRMVKIMPVNRIATRADLNELITNFDQKTFEKRQNENPNKSVEYLTLVCMGHEPDLSAQLQNEMKPFKIDVEVVDILRDKSKLEFKRDSEAEIIRENGKVIINQFYPMNLLQKLSLDKQNVEDWKELVESVYIDFNFDGAIFEPKLVDIPEKNELVSGKYEIPEDAGTIRVKITDLLSESLEMTIK